MTSKRTLMMIQRSSAICLFFFLAQKGRDRNGIWQLRFASISFPLFLLALCISFSVKYMRCVYQSIGTKTAITMICVGRCMLCMFFLRDLHLSLSLNPVYITRHGAIRMEKIGKLKPVECGKRRRLVHYLG